MVFRQTMREGLPVPSKNFVSIFLLFAALNMQCANATVFTVNSPADVDDANHGDGICETATGNGVCTLRAAIEESICKIT